MIEVTAFNQDTGATRKATVPDGFDFLDSVSICTGECECSVEPDGVCPDGWPSVQMAMGII